MLQFLKYLLPDTVIIGVISRNEVIKRLLEIKINFPSEAIDYCIVFNEQNSWQR